MPALKKAFPHKYLSGLQVAQLKNVFTPGRNTIYSSLCHLQVLMWNLEVYNFCQIAQQNCVTFDRIKMRDSFVSSLFERFCNARCFERRVRSQIMLSNRGQADQTWIDLRHSQHRKGTGMMNICLSGCFSSPNQTNCGSLIFKTCE